MQLVLGFLDIGDDEAELPKVPLTQLSRLALFLSAVGCCLWAESTPVSLVAKGQPEMPPIRCEEFLGRLLLLCSPLKLTAASGYEDLLSVMC